MVALSIDPRQMRKLQRALAGIKDGVPKALSPAINRTLNKGRTEVKREIRKDYIIKAKDIPVAVSGATRTRLGGAIIIRQGMLDLNKFKVSPGGVQLRKSKRILRAQVRKSGGGSIPHGFVAQAGSYRGPFVRKGGKGSDRLPIKKLITIGASIMASQPKVGEAVNKAMGDTLAKRIDHEIKRVMASAGGHS